MSEEWEEIGSILHSSTFQYLKPTDEQVKDMAFLRAAAGEYAEAIEMRVPNGPDKTWILRQLRTIAMWANVAVTREADGTPRNGSLG